MSYPKFTIGDAKYPGIIYQQNQLSMKIDVNW